MTQVFDDGVDLCATECYVIDVCVTRHLVDGAVNSILFQRGIYPADEFARVKKYGMTLLMCQQEKVKGFIDTVTAQISTWLQTGTLQRVVLVIASIATKEVLERWNFNIETDKEVVEKG
jgi:mitotic spindle assembly checkpoint protein MAD2